MTTCTKYIYKENTTYKVALKGFWNKNDDVLEYNTDTKNPVFVSLNGANKAEMSRDFKILPGEDKDDTINETK